MSETIPQKAAPAIYSIPAAPSASRPGQQIDFHIGAGLNRAAPSYIIGVGYSIRFDGLF